MFTAVTLSMVLGAEPGAMEMAEARAAVARAIDSVKPSPRMMGSVIKATYRNPVGHTHTCANGHTFDHKDGANLNHVCPFCGLRDVDQDPRPRMVRERIPGTEAGGILTATITPRSGIEAMTTEGPVLYTLAPLGACANGSCAASTRNVSGWYPGKLLRGP
jgi:hypothetical protein